MAEDIGDLVVRVAMENTSFTQGMNDLNRQLKVVQSEFKNATAGTKEHSNSLEFLKSKSEMLSKSINIQSNVVKQFDNKLKESKEALNKNTEAQIILKDKVEASKKAYEESKKSLGANSEKTKELKADYEKLTKEYEKNEEKIRNNVRAIDNYNVKANNAKSKLAEMKSELSNTSNEIAKQSSNWNKLSKELANVQKALNSISDKVGAVGKNLTTKVTTIVGGAGVAISKLHMDFQESMSKISSLTGATGSDLKQLEGKAREMGAGTSKSAKEAADAMGYMALAGYDNQKIMSSIEPVLRLSEAGNLDLARASDLVTDSLSALNLKVQDLPRYLDVLAQSSRRSNTDIDAMMEGFLKVGGTLSNLNVPIEESATFLGMLANRGLKGSEAGQALSSTLTNMTAPLGQSKKALEELGLTAFDENGTFKGLTNTFMELKSKLSGMTEEQQNTYIAMIAGKENIKTVNALLSGLGEEYGSLKGEIDGANGALMEMAKTQQANNKGSLKELMSAVQELALKIGDVLSPSIAKLIDKLKDITNSLNNVNPKVIETCVKIAGLAAAIGPVLLIISKLIKLIGTVAGAFGMVSEAIAVATTGAVASTTAVSGLATVFTALTGPVGIAIALIGGVVATGVAVQKHFSKASLEVQGFGKEVSKGTQEAIGAYEELDNNVGQSLTNLKLNNQVVSKEAADTIVNNFSQMAGQVTQKMNDKFKEQYDNMNNFMLQSKALTDAENADILKSMQEHHNKEVAEVQKGKEQINSIIQTSLEQGKQITAEQYAQIDQIRAEMSTKAIEVMSQSELEQKSLLERQKNNATITSAEQAAEVVKNSVEQRQKVIEEAEKQYDGTVQNIIKMRDETGEITDQQAQKLIDAAKKQKEGTVLEAKNTHHLVVNEAMKQAKDHAKEVDWETGEVKSKWQVMKETVSSKAIEIRNNVVKSFQEQGNKINSHVEQTKKDISTKWNETVNWFDTLPARLKQKAHDMFNNMRNAINEKTSECKAAAQNVGNKIVEAIKDIPSKMAELGGDIVRGLANGIRNLAGSAWEAATELAHGVTNKVKTALDIHSPSRVMKELGKFIDEGLAEGITDNADTVKKATEKVTEMIKSEIAQVQNTLDNDVKKLNGSLDSLKNNKEVALKNLSYEEKNKLNSTKDKAAKERIRKEYDLKERALKAEYAAKEKSIKEQIELRKKQAKEEIDELNKISKMSKEQLKEELKAKEEFTKQVNDLNKTIVEALKEKYKEEQALEEEKISTQLSNLDKWKNESIDRINSVYDYKINKINAELEALDRAEKEKARSDQDKTDLEKINKLKAAIEFEHDEFNKIELQKELDKAIQDRNKRKEKEALEDKKESLKIQKEQLEQKKKNEIENINNIYNTEKETLEARKNEVKKFYEEKTKEAQLNAEAEKLIMSKNQKEIIKLLHSYSKEYEMAGQTLGERLVDGFAPQIEKIKDMISSISAEISSARDNALKLAEESKQVINNTSNTTNNTKNVNYNVNMQGSNSSFREQKRQQEILLRNLSFTT